MSAFQIALLVHELQHAVEIATRNVSRARKHLEAGSIGEQFELEELKWGG